MDKGQPGLSNGDNVDEVDDIDDVDDVGDVEEVDDVDEVDDAPGLLLASEGFWAELRGQTPGTQVSFCRPYYYYLQLFIKQYQTISTAIINWISADNTFTGWGPQPTLIIIHNDKCVSITAVLTQGGKGPI